MVRDKSGINTSMNFQIKSVYFRLDHFTPFCIKVLLGKRTVFSVSSDIPKSSYYFSLFIEWIFYYEFRLLAGPYSWTVTCTKPEDRRLSRTDGNCWMNFQYFGTKSVKLVLDWLVRIAEKISPRREKLHIRYPLRNIWQILLQLKMNEMCKN